jgi:uncharacterized membrane protein
MSTFPIIAISITAVLVILLAVLFVVRRHRGEQPAEPDYRVFFILGITWLPLGISTDNFAFLVMGIVFMIIGIANKDKWPEEKKWSELSSSERSKRLMIILGLALLVMVGAALYFIVGR